MKILYLWRISNYCGPYWSAGEFQQSVDSKVPALNSIDKCCKKHDSQYSKSKATSFFDNQLKRFDNQFVDCAYQVAREEGLSLQGLFALFASGAVNLQAFMRGRGNGRRGGGRFNRGRGRRPINKPFMRKMVRQAEKKVAQTSNPVSFNRVNRNSGNSTFVRPVRPKGKFKKRTGNRKSGGASISKGLRVSGTENFGILQVTTGNVIGDVLFQIQCTPLFNTVGRCAKLASLFDKFILNHMTIKLKTQQSTNIPGEMILGYEPDPEEIVVSSAGQLNKAWNSRPNQGFAPYEGTHNDPVKFTIRQGRKDQARYISTNDPGRTTTYGTIYCVGASTFTQNMTTHTIVVDYDFTFLNPVLEDIGVTDYYYSKFSTTTPSTTAPFGTVAWSPTAYNNIYPQWIQQDTISLPPGYYLIAISLTGTGVAASPFTVNVNPPANATATYVSTCTSGTVGLCLMQLTVKTSTTSIQFVNNGNTTISTATYRITRIPNTGAALKKHFMLDEMNARIEKLEEEKMSWGKRCETPKLEEENNNLLTDYPKTPKIKIRSPTNVEV